MDIAATKTELAWAAGIMAERYRLFVALRDEKPSARFRLPINA